MDLVSYESNTLPLHHCTNSGDNTTCTLLQCRSVLSNTTACWRVLDVVYIATYTPSHVSLSLTMLAAGKHVVCREPMSLTTAGAKKVLDFAHKQGLLYVEVTDGGFCFVIFTPPPVGGRGFVFARFLSLFLCLFLCQQDYEKTAGPICMKFSGKVWSDHGTT